mgnify:FL=1
MVPQTQKRTRQPYKVRSRLRNTKPSPKKKLQRRTKNNKPRKTKTNKKRRENKMIDKATTIKVTQSTKDKLNQLRLTKGESYENIILRLIEKNEYKKQ